MVKYKNILKVIESSLEKTHFNIQQMHQALKEWTTDEKKTLLKYATKDYNEKEYDKLLKNGNEDELWKYERQIFDNISKKRRDNIIKYLTEFNEEDYHQDSDKYYPAREKIGIDPWAMSYEFGQLEKQQGDIQDTKGYSEFFKNAHNYYIRTGFSKIARYSREGYRHKKDETDAEYHLKEMTKVLCDYLDESEGLEENTILFRGGIFGDLDMEIGTVGTIPCLTSATYSQSVQEDFAKKSKSQYKSKMGYYSSSQENNYKQACEDYRNGINIHNNTLKEATGGRLPWNVKIYAPKGTKGILSDTSILTSGLVNQKDTAYEHEVILNRNQKYIVTDIDRKTLTVTVKLINE